MPDGFDDLEGYDFTHDVIVGLDGNTRRYRCFCPMCNKLLTSPTLNCPKYNMELKYSTCALSIVCKESGET